jgi:hypothetical protein
VRRSDDLRRPTILWAGLVVLVTVCVWLPGCKHRPPDAEVKQAASSALASHQQLKRLHLDLHVKDGALTVEGLVPNEATRQEVREAVQVVPGVTTVHDRMQVPPPRVFIFAAGTSVRVQLLDDIDSKVNRAGQTFRATLASPLTSGETVVTPEGAETVLRLIEVEQAGRLKGRSELAVQLASLTCADATYEINSATVATTGESRSRQSARRIGLGAGVGAVFGAIVGGGKGAAIAAGVGGGIATTHQLLTRGPAVRIPAGALIDFHLEQPLSITLPPKL